MEKRKRSEKEDPTVGDIPRPENNGFPKRQRVSSPLQIRKPSGSNSPIKMELNNLRNHLSHVGRSRFRAQFASTMPKVTPSRWRSAEATSVSSTKLDRSHPPLQRQQQQPQQEPQQQPQPQPEASPRREERVPPGNSQQEEPRGLSQRPAIPPSVKSSIGEESASSNLPQLPLSEGYEDLLELFNRLETVCDILEGRRSLCTFSKIKQVIESMYNRYDTTDITVSEMLICLVFFN